VIIQRHPGYRRSGAHNRVHPVAGGQHNSPCRATRQPPGSAVRGAQAPTSFLLMVAGVGKRGVSMERQLDVTICKIELLLFQAADTSTSLFQKAQVLVSFV